MDELHELEGYIRCLDCGVPVIAATAHQQARRCAECWREKSPMFVIEVMNAGRVARIRPPKKERPPSKNNNRGRQQLGGEAKRRYNLKSAARFAAMQRLRGIYPEVYAMLLDEERARRGLAPISRYVPVDPKRVSETLPFDDVYDALRSSGVADGP